jgi:single-strand DNA-binding protein
MYHTIVLAGNLGKDPEMRYTPDGKAVTSFSVAVSDGFGEYKKTIWFRITTWEKTAESCNSYLKKGSSVLIEGRLTPDKETGAPRVYQRQDGTHGSSYEVTATTVRFLSGRPEGGSSESVEKEPLDDETIPF